MVNIHPQAYKYLPDYIETATLSKPASKVTSVNLTGNFNELVVAVGFPDRNPSYPRIYNSSTYPLLGTFRDGTLLSSYVTQRGGSIPVDEWYESAFDTYFNTHSGGVYNVDFTFLKRPDGNPYTTINNFSYFQTLNGGSSNNVVLNQGQEILNEVAQNMAADNSNVFAGISALHFFFNVPGNSKNEFDTSCGRTIKERASLSNNKGI